MKRLQRLCSLLLTSAFIWLSTASFSSASEPVCPVATLAATLRNAFEAPANFKNLDTAELAHLSAEFENARLVQKWRDISKITQNSREGSNAYSLGTRVGIGDEHVEWMIKLGGRVEIHKGVSYMFPPKFEDFLRNYHNEIERLVENGTLARNDAIYPALAYQNSITHERRFVRPGVDPLPRGSEWKLGLPPGDSVIAHELWQKLMAEGKALFAFEFSDHDFGHLTSYLAHPEKKVRAYYRKSLEHSILAPVLPEKRRFFGLMKRKEVEPSGMQMEHGISITTGEQYRISAAEEFLVLPDARHAQEIKKRIPFVYESPSAVSYEKHQSYLQGISKKNPQWFVERAEAMIQESERSLLRVGGAVRDSYNYRVLTPAPSAEYWEKLMHQRSLSAPHTHEIFARGMSENLLSNVRYLKISLFELERLMPELKTSVRPMFDRDFTIFKVGDYGADPKLAESMSAFEMASGYLSPKSKKEFLIQFSSNLLAELESAYRVGIDLKFSPEVLMQDMINGLTPQSKTYRFFKASHDKNSIGYQGFVENSVRGSTVVR